MLIQFAAVGLLLTSWLSFLVPAPAHIERNQAVCSAASGGNVACLAKVRARADGTVQAAATHASLPAGLSPAQLRSAYGVPQSIGGRVAVIVAYDDPSAKTDLDQYSQTFALPVLPNCGRTVQTGCFAKYDQRGGTFYPQRNRGWAFEASLDVQTVHAMCPTCRIDLIEAGSASIANLTAAVDRGVILGSQVVSMSWGAGEFSSETAYDTHFAAPGVSFVAASGDAGYGASWPAASAHIIAAGGTTLSLDAAGNRTAETAWNGTGSGCSAYEAKPVWQTDTGCTRRTIGDVAAVADPATGAAVFSSYSPYGSGWFQVGGTSLATPLIASLVAVAGPSNQSSVLTKLYSSAGSPNIFDVTSGSNGTCTPSYLCSAGSGYDGPTGLGAPIGLGSL